LVIDVTLTVGSASQTVEVSASAVLLQTESASVQKDVTREQIDSLEINGRNPIFMANLVPGTRGGSLANLTSISPRAHRTSTARALRESDHL